MTGDSLLVAILYSLISLMVFWAFYSISRRISGVSLTHRRFWLFFVLLMLWGQTNSAWLAMVIFFYIYHPKRFLRVIMWFDGLLL